jgi:hypothetical protein
MTVPSALARRVFFVLPWALLAAAIVAAITLVRASTPAAAPETVGDAPPPAPPRPHGTGAPSGSATSEAAGGMSDKERRDARMHVSHAECEEGAKRFNELSGRDPTDPRATHLIGSCLTYGNVAWYKCLLVASSQEQAITCNHRFLVPSP